MDFRTWKLNNLTSIYKFIGDTSGLSSFFFDSDTNLVNTDEYNFNKFVKGPLMVKNFPDSLKIKDQIIKIKFRKPFKNANEIPACITFWIDYQLIVMLSGYISD